MKEPRFESEKRVTLTKQERDELRRQKDSFLSSMEDFWDTNILLGRTKPIRRLVTTVAEVTSRTLADSVAGVFGDFWAGVAEG